jgi:hypothetical protein
VDVWITSESGVVGALLLTVRVRDSGVGISPQMQRLLFEPFVQGDQSTTKEHGGLGLGLHVTQKLLRLMGGKIKIDSRTGTDSFTSVLLQVPVEGMSAMPPELTTTPSQRVEAVKAPRNNLVISIVQNPALRSKLEKWLGPAGWGATVVSFSDLGSAHLALKLGGDMAKREGAPIHGGSFVAVDGKAVRVDCTVLDQALLGDGNSPAFNCLRSVCLLCDPRFNVASAPFKVALLL